MSKIMKRPMFRRGGEVTEGIVNMAMPRRQYANSNIDDLMKQFPERADVIKTGLSDAQILQAVAGRPGGDPLANLLIKGGLKTLAAKPRGSTLQTVAGAFEEPVSQALSQKAKEDLFQRQLKLTGVTGAIQQKRTLEQLEKKYKAQSKFRKPGFPAEVRRKSAENYAGKTYTSPSSYPRKLTEGFFLYDVTEGNLSGISSNQINKSKLSVNMEDFDPKTGTILKDKASEYEANTYYIDPRRETIYYFDGQKLTPKGQLSKQ